MTGRKANNNNRRGSQSSVGTPGAAGGGGGGAAKMGTEGGDWAEEEADSPMDARSVGVGLVRGSGEVMTGAVGMMATLLFPCATGAACLGVLVSRLRW